MRVLVLTESFPTPEDPGRGVFIREQVDALSRLHEIRVLFPRPALPVIASALLEPRAESLDSGACFQLRPEVEVDRPAYFYVPRHRGIRAWQIAQAVRCTLRKAPSPYDIVHAHWLSPAGLAAVRGVAEAGIPVVVTAHAGDVYRDLKQPRYFQMAQQVIRGTSRIIAVTDYFREPLLQAGATPEKLRVIPNGVDVGLFAPADRDRARTELRLPTNVPLYLYIGNLQTAKGVADVVEAFFAYALPQAVLVIAGTGPLWKGFSRRASESGGRMILRGWQSHDSVARYLAAADCFVLASYAEGNPVTVLESLCCGRPVIGNSISAIAPLIEEGKNGLLVPPGDVPALGRAMRALPDIHWEHTVIAQQAASRYGWASVAQRISEVYGEAVASACDGQRVHVSTLAID